MYKASDTTYDAAVGEEGVSYEGGEVLVLLLREVEREEGV